MNNKNRERERENCKNGSCVNLSSWISARERLFSAHISQPPPRRQKGARASRWVVARQRRSLGKICYSHVPRISDIPCFAERRGVENNVCVLCNLSRCCLAWITHTHLLPFARAFPYMMIALLKQNKTKKNEGRKKREALKELCCLYTEKSE